MAHFERTAGTPRPEEQTDRGLSDNQWFARYNVERPSNNPPEFIDPRLLHRFDASDTYARQLYSIGAGDRANLERPQQRQETPARRLPFSPRERVPLETIIGSRAWNSQSVQTSLARLRQTTPGTQEWNNQAADLLFEYQGQLEDMNNQRPEGQKIHIISHLDTLRDALLPGGSLYRAV